MTVGPAAKIKHSKKILTTDYSYQIAITPLSLVWVHINEAVITPPQLHFLTWCRWHRYCSSQVTQSSPRLGRPSGKLQVGLKIFSNGDFQTKCFYSLWHISLKIYASSTKAVVYLVTLSVKEGGWMRGCWFRRKTREMSSLGLFGWFAIYNYKNIIANPCAGLNWTDELVLRICLWRPAVRHSQQVP